jgi:hypothetical protein
MKCSDEWIGAMELNMTVIKKFMVELTCYVKSLLPSCDGQFGPPMGDSSGKVATNGLSVQKGCGILSEGC